MDDAISQGGMPQGEICGTDGCAVPNGYFTLNNDGLCAACRVQCHILETLLQFDVHAIEYAAGPEH